MDNDVFLALNNHRQCFKNIDTTLATLIGVCAVIQEILIGEDIVSREEITQRMKEKISFIRAKNAHLKEVREFIEGKR